MKPMTNVDIFTICNELNNLLTGARVDKSYQPTEDTVVMRFHVAGTGRVDLVMQSGVRMHISQYPLENPKTPPTFPMLLRKRLKGAHVLSVKQVDFDRVVEIKFKKDKIYTLIVELFNKGNIILLDDENNIILPLKRQQRTQRDISSKKEYVYPKTTIINPIEIKEEELTQLFKESNTSTVKTLARNGFGSLYAEEIILRANEYEFIDKNTQSKDLTPKQIQNILNAINNIFNPLKNLDFNAQIIGKKDVVPINLKEYETQEKTYFKNFNEACDEFYSKKVNKDIIGIKEKAWNKKVSKYERRLKKQEETVANFENTIKNCQEKGETIYSNYTSIENIVNVINQARDKNYSFKEIDKTIKKAKTQKMSDTEFYESMDKLGNVTLKINNVSINIDIKKTLPENAEIYYEKAKKSKRKIKGALIAIENTKKQLKDMQNKKEIAMEHIDIPKKRVKKNLKWYEKLRWFLSSEGFLVIGGRDANTNEQVVKKHLENNDIYLHADIHGASSIVIKLNKKSLNNQILKESSMFAASFSSAWSKNYTNQDVYWVHPDQVSKTPEAGEHITKGSFVIRGKRNYIRSANLQLAIGIVDYEGKRVMVGPVEALEKHSNNFIAIKPGHIKKEAIAKKILSKINEENLITLDDIVRVLPSGKCDIDYQYHERKRFENR